MWDIIINIVIFLSTSSMAIIPMFYKVELANGKARDFFKRLSPAAKWFFACFAISILFGGIQYFCNKAEERQRDSEHKLALDRLTATIDSTRIDPSEKVNEGSALAAILAINDVPEKRRKFLFDYGLSPDKDRVSLYMDDNNNLVYRIIDSYGEVYSVKAEPDFITFKKGARYFLYCDIGYSDDYSFIRLYLDDRLIGKQEFNTRIKLGDLKSFPNMHIGSDIDGRNNGAFSLMYYQYSSPFNLKQLSALRNIVIRFIETMEVISKDSTKAAEDPIAKYMKENHIKRQNVTL